MFEEVSAVARRCDTDELIDEDIVKRAVQTVAYRTS